jgi:hypothetical protein
MTFDKPGLSKVSPLLKENPPEGCIPGFVSRFNGFYFLRFSSHGPAIWRILFSSGRMRG